MFSHVFIGTNDFPRAFAFYAELLAMLGHRLRFCEASKPWAGWMPGQGERPLLLLGAPFDGQPATPGNGAMVALLAPDRASVDAVHAAALAHGATSEGAPGLRPQYHADYYGAYLRDLDGNKLCVCCHNAVPLG